MNAADLSHYILKEVLINDRAFLSVIKNDKTFTKATIKDKKASYKISFYALKHFFILEKNIRSYLNLDFSLQESIPYLIFLSNNIFAHGVEEKNMSSFLKRMKVSFEIIEKLALFDKNNLFYDKSINGSHLLSLKYNVPIWISDMWEKHFGSKISSLIHKTLKQKEETYIRKFSNNLPLEEKLFNPSGFKGIYKFNLDDSLEKTTEFSNKKIIATNPFISEMFDSCDIEFIRPIAIYQGFPNTYFLDLFSRFNIPLQVDFIALKGFASIEARKLVLDYSLRDIKYYQENPKEISLCISEPVHNFFLFPKSSNFNSILTSVDYALHFKQDDLDGLISFQKSCLENASKCIENGGELIYGVPTINKKETFNLIEEFLSKHSDFKLIKERQFFPFDKYKGIFYYAILKKEADHED